jgi:hypothetical protein
VATGGILSVKPAYAIVPVSGSCTSNACPGASGFTPGLDHTGESHPPANSVAPGPLGPPGIAFRTPQ